MNYLKLYSMLEDMRKDVSRARSVLKHVALNANGLTESEYDSAMESVKDLDKVLEKTEVSNLMKLLS